MTCCVINVGHKIVCIFATGAIDGVHIQQRYGNVLGLFVSCNIISLQITPCDVESIVVVRSNGHISKKASIC